MKYLLNLPKTIFNFFKSVVAETRLIKFLTVKEGFKYTTIVLSVSILITLILLGLDFIFVSFRNYITTV